MPGAKDIMGLVKAAVLKKQLMLMPHTLSAGSEKAILP
jgi:hypothetical protein